MYQPEWRYRFIIEDLNNAEDIDVLFLGSSHVYRGISPVVFRDNGISSFNISSPSQTPVNSYYVLKDYLEGNLGKRDAPKVIVHDIYCKTLNVNGSESFTTSVEGYPLTINYLKLWTHIKDISLLNIYLAARFKDAFGLYEDNRTREDAVNYWKDGYMEIARERGKNNHYNTKESDLVFKNDEELKKFKKSKKTDADICSKTPWPIQLEHIKKMADLSKTYSVPFVLVLVPTPSDFIDNLKHYDSAMKDLKEFATAHEILLIENFSSINLDDSTDFYDRDHLNYKGAGKVSEYLSDLLKQMYPNL